MRVLLTVLSLSLALGAAAAFNADDWHGKRELLTREAERLRAAYARCAARIAAPAEDVTVPVETFDDGSLKVIVYAKRAQYFLDEGLVWAEGVVVKKFKRDGSLDARLDAKTCVVDRFSKSGWAEGPAAVTHGKTVFRGSGIYFSSAEGYVKVFEKSDLESADLKFGGAQL